MSEGPAPTLDQLVAELQAFIGELDQSVAHARRAIDHAGSRRLARLGAHVLAAQGHLANAEDLLDGVSRSFAANSSPDA